MQGEAAAIAYAPEECIIRGKNGKIRIKATDKKQQIAGFTLWVLAALSIYGFATFDYKTVKIGEALVQTMSNVATMFGEPMFKHFTLAEILGQLGVTVGLAVLTTVIGAVLAIFLGLLAAKNISTPRISNGIKGFVAFIRAVPTVLWVLIFAAAAGLGSEAAVIGMSFHSIGYLIKAYSEAFEEIDEGVIEALRSSGANWWQIVFQAVLPSSLNLLLAWTFLRFEINFVNAVAVGAAAGAGGIGYELFMAGNFYFDLHEIGFITYIIVAFALVLEASSTKVKAAIR